MQLPTDPDFATRLGCDFFRERVGGMVAPAHGGAASAGLVAGEARRAPAGLPFGHDEIDDPPLGA